MISGSSERPPLRIGLLVDSFIQRRWIYKIIEDIQASPIAEITLVIKNETQPERWGRLQSYWKNRNYLLYALYTRFDDFRIKVAPDAFENVHIEELISGCPVLNVQPAMKKYSDWFSADDIRRIHEYDLDVALAFGFRILKGEALKIARHGVWSYHHGDNFVNRGGPAGFWEVMDEVPVTGSILQVLTEDLDNGVVIYRSWSPTSDRFSVKANRNNLYWKSSVFVSRKLKELYENGKICASENADYHAYSNRLYRTPTNSEMLLRLSRLGAKYAVSKVRNAFYYDQWSLAYRFKSSSTDSNNTLYQFKHLIPPKDRFWADPFPEKFNDRYFVFIEEYSYKKEKGHISVIEVDKQGISSGPTKILEKDYHLSYPFVFQWRDDYYMIPESASNKTIELYRSTSFPLDWTLEKVLMSGIRAKDSTLLELDGRWWMFVTLAENSIPDELYIYYSASPLGPWTSHKRNPVKSDVRGARPAGRLFCWNGDLYRPAQDSSGRYGYAVSLNRITRLDSEDFLEEEVSKILPNWRKDLLATHTLNASHDLTVIDCLIRRRR